MKIIYLIHQFYPEHYTGTEKIFLNLATMIQKAGHKVKVLTYSFYKETFYDQSINNILIKEFMYKGLPIVAFRHKRIHKDVHNVTEDEEMSRVARSIIKKEKPDIVHVAHPMRVIELVKVLQHLNIPYTLTLTDFFLICPKYTLITSKNTLCNGPEEGKVCQNMCPELPIEFITRRLYTAKDILFNAELVTSLSKLQSNIFEKEFHGLHVKVINPGLRYSTLKKNDRIYSKEDSIVFCYAGSFNPHKGVHLLIDAFKNIQSNDVFLKIYGSGTDDVYVSHLMAMAKGDRRIELCGVYSEEQVGEILKSIDVLIVSSLWYETYCLVLHEALACNVPVISSDVGVMAERIEDNVNGFLFRMGDLQHLKEILQKVADNPNILNTLKHNINLMMIPSVEQEAYSFDREYSRIVTEKK